MYLVRVAFLSSGNLLSPTNLHRRLCWFSVIGFCAGRAGGESLLDVLPLVCCWVLGLLLFWRLVLAVVVALFFVLPYF